jgi:hypothetical protein
VTAALVVSLAGATGASSSPTTTSSIATTTSSIATTTSSIATTRTTVATATSLGPDGVRSSAIAAENARRGTLAWRIAPGTSPTAIEGFANLTYAAVGSTVRFYVTTDAPTFRATAYRMGWYQGLGARQIWTSPVERGAAQSECPLDAATNTVGCDNWRVSFVMKVTPSFAPGDYLIKLVAGPREASYVPLTVWDPTSTAAYVIMNRSLVEQGWNTYGGYSFYGGEGPCIIDTTAYPACNRARVVSFDRPYSSGFGASDFLTNEYPLVQLVEKEGLDVTYITDVTLNEHPNILMNHRALLSLDHDEAWTYTQRLAVHDAVAHGVNVVYFGAAAMVRHVRLEPSPLGPDREEVDYRNAAEDPLDGVGNPMEVTANTWNDPPADWPPTSQIGVEYSGYLHPGDYVPFVVADAASWVFRGIGLRDGSALPGVIGSDFDRVTSSAQTPANLMILAHSPIPAGEATISGGTWDGVSYSDMVYFTDPTSNAGVIDTGDNTWIGDLRPCQVQTSGCSRRALSKITNNILRLFGQGPAGELEPSTSNLRSIAPAGS